jgi:hypothetical protein
MNTGLYYITNAREFEIRGKLRRRHFLIQGGLKAVVWVNVLQFIIMFGSLVAIIVKVRYMF